MNKTKAELIHELKESKIFVKSLENKINAMMKDCAEIAKEVEIQAQTLYQDDENRKFSNIVLDLAKIQAKLENI